MKINLIANEANVAHRVGSNQYAFELLKALDALDKQNQYQVFLTKPPLNDLPRPRKNWQYQVTGFPLAFSCRRPKPDATFVLGHYAPFFCSQPLVVSIMDLGFLRFPDQFTKPIYWKLKYWTRFSLRKASHVLAISQSTKKDLIKFYNLPEGKITVTYPGYDRKRFKIQDSRGKKIRDKYQIKNDYILFLSTLKPNKNVEGLLEGFKILCHSTSATSTSEESDVSLRSTLPPRRRKCLPPRRRRRWQNLQLVIAGRKGWLFESIFAKVSKLGLEDKVIFTGFVPEEEVPALMAGAKAFVLPSFWEGFGIPVVEAMACGTPVVVANRGSLSEIVGNAGVIVDPTKPKSIASGIRQAIKSYDKLSEKGISQARKFSWKKTATQTLAVLKNVVKDCQSN